MINVIKHWSQRYFGTQESVYLLAFIAGLLIVLKTLGHTLTPAIVALVISYLLQGSVTKLTRWKCPRILAVSVVMLLFIGIVLIGLLWVMPVLGRQLNNLFNEVPHIITQGQLFLQKLPRQYPKYISATEIQHYSTEIKSGLGDMGQVVLSYSLSSIPSIISVVVYVILVPLLAFFMLQEKPVTDAFLQRFVPKKHDRLTIIWQEINRNLAAYVRGRALEIVVIGLVSGITFGFLGLRYAALLGALVGVSVIIPYVGAIVATIPVVVIGIWQWGMTAHLLYLLIAYGIIITIDANVLVPLLFSGTMNISVVAIIVSLLLFGGIWGFWGVFFAIPLATVVKALVVYWPRTAV